MNKCTNNQNKVTVKNGNDYVYIYQKLKSSYLNLFEKNINKKWDLIIIKSYPKKLNWWNWNGSYSIFIETKVRINHFEILKNRWKLNLFDPFRY